MSKIGDWEYDFLTLGYKGRLLNKCGCIVFYLAADFDRPFLFLMEKTPVIEGVAEGKSV